MEGCNVNGNTDEEHIYPPLALTFGWTVGMTTLLDAGADPFCALILALYYRDDFALSSILEYDCALFSSQLHISKIRPYNRLHSYNSILSFALGLHEATAKAKTLITGRLVGHRRRLTDWAAAMLSSVERQNACMEIISDGRLLDRFAKPVVLALCRKGIVVPNILWPGERQRSVYHDPNMTLLIAEQLYSGGFRSVDDLDEDGVTPLQIACTNVNFDKERWDLISWYLDKGVIGSIFPVIPWHKNGSETEDARSLAGYLLPHTLRLIELVKILAIRSQDCARLLQTVGGFLTMIGRPFLGSIVAMKALEMAPNVFDVNEASIHYIRRYAINSLVANAQYAEAEKECRVALKTLDSPEFQSHHNKASLLMERHTVLTHQIGALRGVQKYAEAENSYIAIERIWTELRNMVSSEGEEIDLARDRATQVHNLANVIQSQGRIDEARRLIEESLKIIDSIRNTNGSKEIASMDRTYTTMMNLKAQIMLQSLQKTDLSFEIADKQRYEAQNIFMSSFRKCFDLFGVTDIDTWKAANFCVGIMFDRKQYNEAMDILLKMGLAAKTADMAIEGQKLETFAITFHDVISLGSILRIIYNANMRTKAAMITQVYEYLVETKAAESIVKYTAPVQLNNYAVSLIQKGCFRHAERVLKELLPKNSTDTFIVEYYNLMLAISRQPGRQGEAYRFREQHIDKIASAEATYGDLTTRLRRDEEDLTTYEEAKTKIENGQLAFGDAWWTEHEEALSRAEFRYEILFDDVPYEDSEANTPPMDSTTKGILMEMAESRR